MPMTRICRLCQNQSLEQRSPPTERQPPHTVQPSLSATEDSWSHPSFSVAQSNLPPAEPTFLALFRLVGSSIGAALRACLLLVPYRRELTRELPLGPFDATIVGAAATPRHVRLMGYVDAKADGANYRRRWRSWSEDDTQPLQHLAGHFRC